MSNPFVPGSDKVSSIGKSASEEMVKQVAEMVGLDATKIDLMAENRVLWQRAVLADANKDYVGFISYVMRGAFLSVLCGDYKEGLRFAKEFVKTKNPSAANKITELEIARIAALYAACLGSADIDKINSPQDAETVVRMEFIDKSHIHAAAKLVSRFARFNAFAVGVHGSMDILKSFAELMRASAAGEVINSSITEPGIKNMFAASATGLSERFARALKSNDASDYSVFVMQVVYNYCVFVNIGLYDVKALINLLSKIEAFAMYNQSERITDIARMIREDFVPNADYGE